MSNLCVKNINFRSKKDSLMMHGYAINIVPEYVWYFFIIKSFAAVRIILLNLTAQYESSHCEWSGCLPQGTLIRFV